MNNSNKVSKKGINVFTPISLKSTFTYYEFCICSHKDSTLHAVPLGTEATGIFPASLLEVPLLVTDEHHCSLSPIFLFICQKTIYIKPHTLTNLQTSIQWDATGFPKTETNTLSDSSHELVVFCGLTKKKEKPMSQK